MAGFGASGLDGLVGVVAGAIGPGSGSGGWPFCFQSLRNWSMVCGEKPV